MTNSTEACPTPINTFLAAKPGQGTTVTAAAFALLNAYRGRRTLLVDASPGQDCPAALGLPEPHDPTDVLAVTPTMDLVLATRATDRGTIGDGYDLVVIDAGTKPTSAVGHLTLVTRACYLSLRKATSLEHRPHDIVLLEEPGRALSHDDVADVLGLTIAATIAVEPAIARAIDSGLLAARLPNPFRSLAAIETGQTGTPATR